MEKQARSLSSRSTPGCRNCSSPPSKISHAEYFWVCALLVISQPSHVIAVRESRDALFILLFSPASRARKTGFPILIMFLAILPHHVSVSESCIAIVRMKIQFSNWNHLEMTECQEDHITLYQQALIFPIKVLDHISLMPGDQTGLSYQPSHCVWFPSPRISSSKVC